MKDQLICITGGGGFIGGHLIADLRRAGFRRIRAVDCKPLESWHQRFDDVENLVLDLMQPGQCSRAARDAFSIYNLASDMGGMGFIENNRALCMLSVMINTRMLTAAREAGTANYFFSSSACVYSAEKQASPEVTALKESDAYPAMPEDGYGWEKLFSERMCRHFREDFGLSTRIARYHNVYGPLGTFEGGREKVPAAMCRKIIAAKLSGHQQIEIWGDGSQTRSFTFVDDCVIGTRKIMESDVTEPLNLGSSRLVSINQLVDIIEDIAGVRLKRIYKPDAPRGVAGRNSDNTLIRERLGWEPSISLADGLERTYAWIYDQMRDRYPGRSAAPVKASGARRPA